MALIGTWHGECAAKNNLRDEAVRSLLQWCGLSPKKKEEVFGIYFTRLQRRLLKCSDTVARLKKSRDQSITNVASVVEQGARSAPFVTNLEDELETFLYEAKLFLRDTLNVINRILASVAAC